MPKKTVLIVLLVVALIYIVGLIIAVRYDNSGGAQTTATQKPSPTNAISMSTCGVHPPTTVKIMASGRLISRKVETFFPWGCPGKPPRCNYSGPDFAYPDTVCSPGAIYDLTGNTDPARYDEAKNRDIICESTTDGRRLVTTSLKRAVLREYGLMKPAPDTIQIDHIVALSLGGSSDMANLYPQRSTPYPGFKAKDKVDSELGRSMCARTIGLRAAQDIIAHSWVTYAQSHHLS